jgi:hypothetical protein
VGVGEDVAAQVEEQVQDSPPLRRGDGLDGHESSFKRHRRHRVRRRLRDMRATGCQSNVRDDSPLREQDAMPTMTLEDRTVAFDRAGEGSATPLLLVHGFTGGKDDFAGVLPALAEDRPVVAVDLPGHGGSEGADDPAAYDLFAVAGWVLRFADALGPR